MYIIYIIYIIYIHVQREGERKKERKKERLIENRNTHSKVVSVRRNILWQGFCSCAFVTFVKASHGDTISGRISEGRIGEAYIYTYQTIDLHGPHGGSWAQAGGRPAGRPAGRRRRAYGTMRPAAGGDLANWRTDSLGNTACYIYIYIYIYIHHPRVGA